MKINIGDKVRFLNDVGGGTVIKIISKSQVIVQDDNKFEYPFPVSELIVVEKASTKTEEQPKEEEQKISKSNDIEIKADNNSEVLFAFVKEKEENSSNFECFLINDSNFFIFYHIVLRGENGFEKIDAEILEPNTKVSVGKLSRSQINFSKEIITQMLFFDHPYQTLHQMIERKIKIVPINFFQEYRFIENDFIDERAYIFELLKETQNRRDSINTQEEFDDNIQNKELSFDEEDKSKKFEPRKKAPTIEIDLHINQLVESVIGLSNAEILQIQMDVFHKTMTNAIMNKAGKVILIHGIGNGTLKSALRESLDVQYKLNYEDASFKEYGFGATMVIL
jgi:hypothetical protein